MKATKISHLLLCFFLTTAMALFVTRLLVSQGINVPAAPWSTCAVLLISSGYLLVSGWPIRRQLHGDDSRNDSRTGGRGQIRNQGRKQGDRIDGLQAARLVRIVKASSLGGSVLAGLYASQLLLALNLWSFEAQRFKGIWGGAAAVCSLCLVIVALMVEKWCTLPPDQFDGMDAEPEGAA